MNQIENYSSYVGLGRADLCRFDRRPAQDPVDYGPVDPDPADQI
jgi:hypothetical protein